MTPTVPVNPAQRIDSTFRNGVLLAETIHNYPHDGGGIRRIEDNGVVTTTPVTGLSAPVVSPADRTAEAVTLADMKEAAGAGGAATSPVQRAAVVDLLTKVQVAVANNATYLALAAPSAAQNTAQAKALTRQINAVMKLLAGMYGDHSKLVVGTDT